MADSEQFTAHATRCQAEAEVATLDNVRDRALRAAAAWTAMANTSRKTEAARAAREAATVARAADAVTAG